YLSHQTDAGIGLQHIFVILAVVLVATIPIVFLIPERGQIPAGRPVATTSPSGGRAVMDVVEVGE
ncbi:MAG: hypothetical protein WCL53_05680, partial [Chloroflexota bacterium]